MCQSQADGGKRCAAHTRPAYMVVMDRIMSTSEDLRPGLASANSSALIAHAMTPAGANELADAQAKFTKAFDEDPSRTTPQETSRQELLATLRLVQIQAEIRADIEENIRRRDRYTRTGTHAETSR